MIIAGLLLAAIGVVVWLLARAGFRGLPGDIVYHSDNVRIYAPIVSCLVLSLLITALTWLWQWLRR